MPLIKFVGIIKRKACSFSIRTSIGETYFEDCLRDFCKNYCLNEQELIRSYIIMCNGRRLDPIIDKQIIIGSDDELAILMPFEGG